MSECSTCHRQIGSFDERGKEIKKAAANKCKRCYTVEYKNKLSNTCGNCGGKLVRPSSRAFCKLCKKVNKEEYRLRTNNANKNRTKAEKQTQGVPMTILQREEIRRLLVMYKWGLQNSVDHYRLISVYLEIYNADEELSSFTEESQIIIVLKTLKKLFDAPFVEYKPKLTADIKQYQKNWRTNHGALSDAKRRQKYIDNKDKYKAYQDEWKKNNPDKIEAYKVKKRKVRGSE